MWYFLALSLFAIFFNKKVSVLILMFTAAIGIFSDVLDWRAIVFLSSMGIIAFVYYRSTNKILLMVLEIVLLLASVGLMLHMIPGFHNLIVLDSVRVGQESAPFTMYYNFDKALVPFLLCVSLKTLFTTEARIYAKSWYWFMLVLAVPLLLIVAVALGGLKFEPHQPEWLLKFVLANVFFVSLAEEALFRGYLQQRLSAVMHPILSLVIASLLFGGLHYAGGSLMVIFATLAGLIYGLAWMFSGRLWVAVLFHVCLNLCHLLLFTYPVLQRLPQII